MASKDQIDHDALAAEWGVALEAEQNAAGGDAKAAEGDDASAQWASMENSNFIQTTKGGAERVLTQD
jgi:flagellar motor switch protein FliM